MVMRRALTGTFSTGCSLSGITLGDDTVHNAHTHNGSSGGSPYPFLYFSRPIVINSAYDSAVYTSTKGTYKHFLPIPNPLGVRQLRGEGSESSVSYIGGPHLTFDGYNKLSINDITPTSSTLKYGSNTYDIGTATNIYIENAGAYTAETKNADVRTLTSNTVSGTIKTIEPGFASRYHGKMALTYDGKLYAWGENSDGEAGVGTTSDITVPTLCKGITQGTVAKLLRILN